MKMMLTILLCRCLHFLGSCVGRGSSKPGQIALRLVPDILSRVSLPDCVVAVTGSSGKTSTVEMIAHILRSDGRKVACNEKGSNQIEGIATLILSCCSLRGRVKSEILLFEIDERFARHTFQYFTPTHYLITNLYRDQLTRNGHPEWVCQSIKESIRRGTKLILNGDDPLVTCLGLEHGNFLTFGVDRMPDSTEESTGLYNDSKYCPRCGSLLNYEYYHYNHIGKYHCPVCGLERPEPDFAVTKMDLITGELVISRAALPEARAEQGRNPGRSQSQRIHLAFPSLYCGYNVLAAYSTASVLGVDERRIVTCLNNYTLKNGRITNFCVGQRTGVLLISKHENSISYDQSLRVAAAERKDCTVVVIVDQVSRKYFTSEVSWLWDVDFELLAGEHIKRIVLAGKYCSDLAVRLSYCEIPAERISVVERVKDAVTEVKENGVGKVYVITCFSDKDKFLSKVDHKSVYQL